MGTEHRRHNPLPRQTEKMTVANRRRLENIDDYDLIGPTRADNGCCSDITKVFHFTCTGQHRFVDDRFRTNSEDFQKLLDSADSNLRRLAELDRGLETKQRALASRLPATQDKLSTIIPTECTCGASKLPEASNPTKCLCFALGNL